MVSVDRGGTLSLPSVNGDDLNERVPAYLRQVQRGPAHPAAVLPELSEQSHSVSLQSLFHHLHHTRYLLHLQGWGGGDPG